MAKFNITFPKAIGIALGAIFLIALLGSFFNVQIVEGSPEIALKEIADLGNVGFTLLKILISLVVVWGIAQVWALVVKERLTKSVVFRLILIAIVVIVLGPFVANILGAPSIGDITFAMVGP